MHQKLTNLSTDIRYFALYLLLALFLSPVYAQQSPVTKHGQLSIVNGQIVNQQLKS